MSELMSGEKSIANEARQVVEEFSLFDDWMMRYEHLIDMGRSLPAIDPTYRTDAYRIKGCQSQVWLHVGQSEGCIRLSADSDAMITKGLIALLIRVLNNQLPKDVARADLSFLDQIGMKEHLSPTRKNGLDAMIRQIKLYAVGLAGITKVE